MTDEGGANVTNEGGANVTDEKWEPKIFTIFCNWCTYAGADLAGTSRLQYPPNTRTIRVMCTGRVNPQFIAKAFQEGADGVLVSGCHPGECHYETGNILARRKFTCMRELLDFIGVDGKRFQVSWVSASEGPKFQEVITNFVKQIKEMGPQDKLSRRDIIE